MANRIRLIENISYEKGMLEILPIPKNENTVTFTEKDGTPKTLGVALRVRLPIGMVEVKNENGRTYEKDDVIRAFKDKDKMFKEGGLMGFANHPKEGEEGDLTRLTHYQREAYIDDKNVQWGVFDILETTAGKDLAIAIQNGPVGLSTRGYGEMAEGKVKNYEYEGTDFVHLPSARVFGGPQHIEKIPESKTTPTSQTTHLENKNHPKGESKMNNIQLTSYKADINKLIKEAVGKENPMEGLKELNSLVESINGDVTGGIATVEELKPVLDGIKTEHSTLETKVQTLLDKKKEDDDDEEDEEDDDNGNGKKKKNKDKEIVEGVYDKNGKKVKKKDYEDMDDDDDVYDKDGKKMKKKEFKKVKEDEHEDDEDDDDTPYDEDGKKLKKKDYEKMHADGNVYDKDGKKMKKAEYMKASKKSRKENEDDDEEDNDKKDPEYNGEAYGQDKKPISKKEFEKLPDDATVYDKDGKENGDKESFVLGLKKKKKEALANMSKEELLKKYETLQDHTVKANKVIDNMSKEFFELIQYSKRNEKHIVESNAFIKKLQAETLNVIEYARTMEQGVLRNKEYAQEMEKLFFEAQLYAKDLEQGVVSANQRIAGTGNPVEPTVAEYVEGQIQVYPALEKYRDELEASKNVSEAEERMLKYIESDKEILAPGMQSIRDRIDLPRRESRNTSTPITKVTTKIESKNAFNKRKVEVMFGSDFV